LGAGGDDGVAEADAADFSLFQADSGGAFELGPPFDQLDAAPGAKMNEAVGHRVDHLLFPAPDLGQFEPRRVVMESHRRRLAGVEDQFGQVQTGLRGDAAFKEADPARLGPGVDQGHIEAQVGGPKGGGVAGRAAADDQGPRRSVPFHP